MKFNPCSRPHYPFSASLLAALATFFVSVPAQAATLYWDTNGSTAGAGVTADGAWNTTATNWTSDSTGESATSAYVDASDVVFSAGTDMATANITASGTLNAQSITVEEGSIVVSGAIRVGSVGTAGAFTVASGASATLNNDLVLNNNVDVTVDGTLDLKINGAGKTFNKYGSGTVTINDTTGSDYSIKAYGGLVVLQRVATKQLKVSEVNDGGTVRLAANEQFGGNLSVNTGGSLQLDAGITETVAALNGGGSVTGGVDSSLGMTSGTFSGSISGDVDLVKTGTGTFTLTGTNTSTGNTAVNGGTFTLASGAEMTFYIGENGINNAVTGVGTANFNGSFAFDLTAADLTSGNSWLIVDVGTLTESFAGTFSVVGFDDTDADNIWTNGAGFSFDESTGMLSYSAIPEPSAFALLLGAGALMASVVRRKGRR